MFEQAREAMEQATQQETHSDSPNAETITGLAPETTTTENQEQRQEAVPQAPSVYDLEKLEKFTYKGKEMTARDLESAMMRQQDYTKKTQEIAQERKYNDNLRSDLESVMRNPSLAEQFKSIYPEKYHGYLDFILNKAEAKTEMQQPTQAQQASWKDDPTYRQFQSEFSEWKQFQTAEQQRQAEATIDNVLQTMAGKYKISPEMKEIVEEVVISRANIAAQQGMELNNDTWDKIYKSAHDALTNAGRAYQKTLVTKQSEANLKAKDVAKGGGTPGQAPKKMSFKEATEAAIASMNS